MTPTLRIIPTQRYLHPQVPKAQVIDCLADALLASFSSPEWAQLKHQLGIPAVVDPHDVITDWISDCLVDPDWQLAHQILPLLLSRLEAQLMTRRTNA